MEIEVKSLESAIRELFHSRLLVHHQDLPIEFFFLIHRSVWSNLNSAKDGEILRGSDAQPSSPASDLARRVLTGDAVGPSCGARVTKAAALVSSFPTATSTGANFRGKDGMSQEWRGERCSNHFAVLYLVLFLALSK